MLRVVSYREKAIRVTYNLILRLVSIIVLITGISSITPGAVLS
jgi:hypothetical protein